MEIGKLSITMTALPKDAHSAFFSHALSCTNSFATSTMNSELEQKSEEKIKTLEMTDAEAVATFSPTWTTVKSSFLTWTYASYSDQLLDSPLNSTKLPYSLPPRESHQCLFYPPNQSQQDLQYCLDKYTNPCAETLDGVDILGYPIDNKKFMTNSLLKTDVKLLSDTTNLFNDLPSLQTSTTLFKHCLLTRLPYQACTDVLTSPLPATHTDPYCRQTTHTRRIDEITKKPSPTPPDTTTSLLMSYNLLNFPHAMVEQVSSTQNTQHLQPSSLKPLDPSDVQPQASDSPKTSALHSLLQSDQLLPTGKHPLSLSSSTF
eukprot:scaffold70157_cov31-Attheya_sp.AAC.2